MLEKKAVLESLKDLLQNVRIFFHFIFRFLLIRDFEWVTEFFQLPT